MRSVRFSRRNRPSSSRSSVVSAPGAPRPASISAWRTQLRSAVSNLVYNAIHYTPAGRKITVEWRQQGAMALFVVQDEGEGIAPEHLARLTERFYRVDKARSRHTGGSGLGLAIVKHALSHHDAQLEIESRVGVGSRFSFLIPARMVVVK